MRCKYIKNNEKQTNQLNQHPITQRNPPINQQNHQRTTKTKQQTNKSSKPSSNNSEKPTNKPTKLPTNHRRDSKSLASLKKNPQGQTKIPKGLK